MNNAQYLEKQTINIKSGFKNRIGYLKNVYNILILYKRKFVSNNSMKNWGRTKIIERQNILAVVVQRTMKNARH